MSIRNDRGDRRSRRTVHALAEAALETLERDGWDALTVSSICDRAGVGRSTFYLHFSSPSDPVYEALRTRYAKEFPDIASASSSLNPETLLAGGKPLSYPLYAHVESHRAIYEKILSDDRGAAVVRRIQADVQEISNSQHASIRRISATPPDPGRTAAYLAGALVASARWWVLTRSDASALEMAYWFSRMAAPGLLEIMGLSHIVSDE
jgi:AcrR family transcriptional regulator